MAASKSMAVPLFLLAVVLAATHPLTGWSDPAAYASGVRRADTGVVHIERPMPEKFFPFHTTDSEHCVTRGEIEDLSGAVRQALEGGVRVFPRNGFLLGIVRHGGFLPTEHVDADLGIIASDLDKFEMYSEKHGKQYTNGKIFRAAGFKGLARNLQNFWHNWQGLNPVTGEPYEFMSVILHGKGVALQCNSLYEYGDTGKFFFPWLSGRKNHEAALGSAIHYNEEGADIRILDTDERLDANNYRSEAQMGTVMDTDLTCFVEKQFYHTTIPVPCDYDKILTAQYGRSWHHVESRGDIAQDDGKETKYVSAPVSEEANDALLWGGPRPICMQSTHWN